MTDSQIIIKNGAKKGVKMAKTIDEYTLPARLVAEITGAKPDTVQKQRKGWRIRGKVAKKIALVDEMYKTGHNQLIEAVKQAVNF